VSYATILMDPPWFERGGGRRGADMHYPLVKTPDLPGVIYGSGVFRPADDAHLFMWATNSFLSDAIWLMGALGFVYKTNVAWVKINDEGRPQVGLGQYFRGAHELLLLGTRGRGAAVRTDDRSLPSVILAPRRKHSQKPEEAYALVEARSHGPRLEMFARQQRPGWTAWGNGVEKNNDPDVASCKGAK
jgi:N6-adenosine-specific RNA methylase IME4